MRHTKQEIKTEKMLKKELRGPYQSTKFLYKVLDVAENQLRELSDENHRLVEENLRLKALAKRRKR